MKMSDVILETRNLSKKYKDKYALDNASVTLEKNTALSEKTVPARVHL